MSDITYWKLKDNQMYISFITDAYSHKIVGYQVAETMEAIESIHALQMTLSALGAESHLQFTHHCDRGNQYCSHAYVKLLQDNNIKISITENGDPLENALAERVNDIIKDEYLYTYDIENIKEDRELLKLVIDLYKNERPHMSIGNFTPNVIDQLTTKIKTEKLWKNYYKKTYYCKPVSGLKINCRLFLGRVKLFD